MRSIQIWLSAVSRRILYRQVLPCFFSSSILTSFSISVQASFYSLQHFLPHVLLLAPYHWLNHDLHLEFNLGLVSGTISNRLSTVIMLLFPRGLRHHPPYRFICPNCNPSLGYRYNKANSFTLSLFKNQAKLFNVNSTIDVFHVYWTI